MDKEIAYLARELTKDIERHLKDLSDTGYHNDRFHYNPIKEMRHKAWELIDRIETLEYEELMDNIAVRR